MFGDTIRNILNKNRSIKEMFFSLSLLTGCRRLALNGTVDDKLVGTVADISFESVV